ncbi:hypothetical protein WJX74_001557 [Apatococcus lobatus]|uniref:RING-type E3 ubiquitin transferase n=1 Tax=Apatococcus lobatus TaxID=904363 RepID=A0AAW1QHU5_9CHLO
MPPGYQWLPYSQIWAKTPEATAVPVPRKARKRTSSSSSATATAPVTPQRPELTEPSGPEKAHLASELHSSELDSTQACPICLSDIEEQTAKAVVLQCMHVFCLACLSQWLALKRSCPMCKRRIQGYLYGIESESSFKECTVPRSPSPPPQRRHSSQHRPRLRDFDAPLNHLGHHQRHHGYGATHGAVPRGEGVALIDEPRRSEQPSVEGIRPSRWTQGQSLSSHQDSQQTAQRLRRQIRGSQRNQLNRRSHAGQDRGSEGGDHQQGPRPYYWRVQQRLQARAEQDRSHLRSRLPTTAGQSADVALDRRREIYAEGLWATPVGAPGGHRLPSASGYNGLLRAWVERELKALLPTTDTTIVTAFVMGLVSSHQATTDRPAGQPAGLWGSPRRPQATGPAWDDTRIVDALQPFLQDRSRHFWHELRCFAACSYTIPIYDRLVKHTKPPSLEQCAPSASLHHASLAQGSDALPPQSSQSAANRSQQAASSSPTEPPAERPQAKRRRIDGVPHDPHAGQRSRPAVSPRLAGRQIDAPRVQPRMVPHHHARLTLLDPQQPSHSQQSPASSVIDLISDDEADDSRSTQQTLEAESGPCQQSLPEVSSAQLLSTQQPPAVPASDAHNIEESQYMPADGESSPSVAASLLLFTGDDTAAQPPTGCHTSGQPHAHARSSLRAIESTMSCSISSSTAAQHHARGLARATIRPSSSRHDADSNAPAANRVEAMHEARCKLATPKAVMPAETPLSLSEVRSRTSAPDLLSQLRAQALARHAAVCTVHGKPS